MTRLSLHYPSTKLEIKFVFLIPILVQDEPSNQVGNPSDRDQDFRDPVSGITTVLAIAASYLFWVRKIHNYFQFSFKEDLFWL